LGSIRRHVKALIFDFDGLMVDSESPGFQAWSEIYAAHGCSLPFDKYAACIGTERWLQLMIAQPLLPGIASCISSARARGLKLAVASSSTHDWVGGNLEKFQLLDHFDAICTRDHVDAVKPDPALYLLALERLGIEAAEAIAFEDSPHGVQAAKRAGIFCIAIPNALTKRLSLDLADRRLNSMEEFNLDDACRLRSPRESDAPASPKRAHE
jgi:HAD superfamily hydrolase (TIGR01509 family)